MRRRLPQLFLSLLAFAPCLAADVIVVDETGGGDFTELQPAIDVASVGDTLLVKSGTYLTFTLSKGLEILADSDAEVLVVTAVVIESLPADEVVLLHGLELPATTVNQCAGVVWLEDVVINSRDSLTVIDSQRVVVSESSIEGAVGFNFGVFSFPPGRGIVATNSTIFLPGTDVAGGQGWGGAEGSSGWNGSRGAAGVELNGSVLVLGGSSIAGGKGGSGASAIPPCADAGDGGPGVQFVGAPSTVHRLDSSIAGGEGGTDPTLFPACFSSNGAPGPATIGDGAIEVLGTTGYLGMTTNSPVREGELLLLTFDSAPSVPTVVAFSAQPEALLVPELFGGLFFQAPYVLILTGTTDATGFAVAGFPIGNLPPALTSVTFYAQSAYVTAANVVVVGSPAALPVLDESF